MYTVADDHYNCSMGHLYSLVHVGNDTKNRMLSYRNMLRRVNNHRGWGIVLFSDNLHETKIKQGYGGLALSQWLANEGFGSITESPAAPSSHGPLAPPIKAWLWNVDHKKIMEVLEDNT